MHSVFWLSVGSGTSDDVYNIYYSCYLFLVSGKDKVEGFELNKEAKHPSLLIDKQSK